jgi:hypothetical protein
MEKCDEVLRLRRAIDGVVPDEETVAVELRFIMPVFCGRLDRCGTSSKDDRALSSKGFSSRGGGGGSVTGGFPSF